MMFGPQAMYIARRVEEASKAGVTSKPASGTVMIGGTVRPETRSNAETGVRKTRAQIVVRLAYPLVN